MHNACAPAAVLTLLEERSKILTQLKHPNIIKYYKGASVRTGALCADAQAIKCCGFG